MTTLLFFPLHGLGIADVATRWWACPFSFRPAGPLTTTTPHAPPPLFSSSLSLKLALPRWLGHFLFSLFEVMRQFVEAGGLPLFSFLRRVGGRRRVDAFS